MTAATAAQPRMRWLLNALLAIGCCVALCSLALPLVTGKPVDYIDDDDDQYYGDGYEDDDVVGKEAGAPLTGTKRYVHSFVAGFMMMIVSEIGDKTFFIAAILAMRHSRLVIFLGAISALGLMTVLSAYIGSIATYIPKQYTTWIGTILFIFFGLKLIKEGYEMSPEEGAEELEEVTQELKETEDKLVENPRATAGTFAQLFSPVFVQSFVLTFLAEWGDRSQIATIILGAREDPLGVTIGAILGHSLCTILAVVGGRLLAQRISIKSVTLIGGITFLIFAVTSIVFDEDVSLSDIHL